MFSTSGGVQYIGGCSVHRRDAMSTSWRYHEYNGRRDIMIHVGEQLDKILLITIENSDVLNIPDVLIISPRYTHGIPLMYWKSPDVLMVSPTCIMISPRCTEHPPTGFSLVGDWGIPHELYVLPHNSCVPLPPLIFVDHDKIFLDIFSIFAWERLIWPT